MNTEQRLLDALAAAEGEADEVTRARVEADPALRAEAQGLEPIVGRLRAVEPALPPPELRGSILAALEAEAGPAPARAETSWFWRLARLGLAGAAGAVLLGLGIGGSGLGVSPSPPPPRPGVQLASWDGPGMAPGSLGPGDLVKIPAGARATLDWRGRGPLELHEDSVVLLEEHAVQLIRGTVVSSIDPEDTVGFQVRTDDAVVSVVGTRFRVTYQPERGTEVQVFEGEVRVEDLRSRLVSILTPALRAIWQAWNVDDDSVERPGARRPLARRPPPATRPAEKPPEPGPPPELPAVENPPPSLEVPPAKPGDDDATSEDDGPDEDSTDEADDEAVAAKSGAEDEPEEDEPEDPSYVPADTVEQGF